MFDFGMSELLVIGVVALIVIGPKDLPELFRNLGRFTAKMRGMAREFSRAMEAAADESGVKDVARDLKTATSAKSMGLDAVREATSKFEKWDPLKTTARPTATAAAKTEAPSAVGQSAPDASSKPELQPDPQAAPPADPASAATTKPAVGPETQALTEAKAARQAIVQEATAKLKKAAAAPDPAGDAADKPKKPRSPRKPKSDKTPKADA